MTTEITARIKAEADTDWPALCAWLADKRYPKPARYVHPATTADQLGEDNADSVPYTDGTWDEVRRARDVGLLTNDQYLEVCKAADKSNPKGETVKRMFITAHEQNESPKG